MNGGVYILNSTSNCVASLVNKWFLDSVPLSDKLKTEPPNLAHTLSMKTWTTSMADLDLRGIYKVYKPTYYS